MISFDNFSPSSRKEAWMIKRDIKKSPKQDFSLVFDQPFDSISLFPPSSLSRDALPVG